MQDTRIPIANVSMSFAAHESEHPCLSLVHIGAPPGAVCTVCTGAVCSKEAVTLYDKRHSVFVCLQEGPCTSVHVFHRGCIEYLLWDPEASSYGNASPCGCLFLPPPVAPQVHLNPNTSVLGLDIGNVIRDNRTGLLVEGAVECVRVLVECLGKERVYLISKAKPVMQEKSRAYLKSNQFFEQTGLQTSNLIFCLERADKEPICRRLGITHFVDDHVDVLKHLTCVPYRVLFRPDSKEILEKARACQGGAVEVADSWAAVLRLLMPV